MFLGKGDSMKIYDRYKQLRDIGYDYDKAHEVLKRECIEAKQFSQFVNYLLSYSSHTDYADSFLEALLLHGETVLFKKYWKKRLSEQLQYFWELYAYFKEGEGWRTNRQTLMQEHYTFEVELSTKKFLSYDRSLLNENHDKYPAYQDSYLEYVWYWHDTLDFIDCFIEEMKKIDALNEIGNASGYKDSIYHFKKPRAKKTTDKRKIDEALFWELIEKSQKESELGDDALDILRGKLESFSATEIKKFKKHFLNRMNELYSWDIWALAYIVRKGCGDDGFDYFCAWVISKGSDTFESVRTLQYDKLQTIFAQEDPQQEDMLYVANEAYENKKSEEMPEPSVKSPKIMGTKWGEESICKSYPKLCDLFGYSV